MSPGDFYADWSAQLKAEGAGAAVQAIRTTLLAAGAAPAPMIRALELLFVAASLEQVQALTKAIQEDLRMLRRSYRGVPAEHVRAEALARTKQELDEKIARLKCGAPEDVELQREIEALGNDERQLEASIAQLEAELTHLNAPPLQALRESAP